MKRYLLLLAMAGTANAAPLILTNCDATYSMAVTAMKARQSGVEWTMMEDVGKDGTVTQRVLRSAYKFPVQDDVGAQQSLIHRFANDWKAVCVQLRELGETL